MVREVASRPGQASHSRRSSAGCQARAAFLVAFADGRCGSAHSQGARRRSAHGWSTRCSSAAIWLRCRARRLRSRWRRWRRARRASAIACFLVDPALEFLVVHKARLFAKVCLLRLGLRLLRGAVCAGTAAPQSTKPRRGWLELLPLLVAATGVARRVVLLTLALVLLGGVVSSRRACDAVPWRRITRFETCSVCITGLSSTARIAQSEIVVIFLFIHIGVMAAV